jgi:hypothetical protein
LRRSGPWQVHHCSKHNEREQTAHGIGVGGSLMNANNGREVMPSRDPERECCPKGKGAFE